MIDSIKREFLKALQLFQEVDKTTPKIYNDGDIKLSDKVVGGKVELVDANGELMTAPDADYKMEDGTEFTVVDGLITKISGIEDKKEDATDATDSSTKMEDVTEDVTDEDMAVDTVDASSDTDSTDDATDAPVETVDEDLSQRIASLEEIVKKLQESLSGQFKDEIKEEVSKSFTAELDSLKSDLNSVSDTVKKFGSIPNVSVTNQNSYSKSEELDKRQNKIVEFAKALKAK